MKRVYEKPVAACQVFEANEYVAACITGTIQCAYPGSSPTEYDDGTDTYKDSSGMWHGLCGNDAAISFNGDTATGYEVHNGVVDRSRPIYNISGYTAEAGTYYGVTWTSTDGNGVYQHTGRLIITNVDSNRPNHS